MRTHQKITGIAILLLSTIWFETATLAQDAPLTFNVNTVADLVDDNINDGLCHTSANTCSLRAAVMQANHSSAAQVVINLPRGTYALTLPPSAGDDETWGDLNLGVPLMDGQSVTINGAGASSSIIDANYLYRAFKLGTGRVAYIANVTLRNGNPDQGGGGAIYMSGATLTLRDSIMENNRASAGGAIDMSESTLTIIRSTIRANVATANGGAIILGGSLTIRNSTFYGNGADTGGAISNFGLAVAVNSTFYQNYANTNGGAIFNANKVYLYNSSIVDNDADHDRDELGGVGGGIFAQSNSTTAVVNTIVVDNTIEDAPIYNDCSGTLVGYGANLFSETSGCSIGGAWVTVPLGTIGSLQNNGGPTLTLQPHADSSAIDNSNDALGCVDETGAKLTIDQRGAPRVFGPRCDIGAVEFGAVVDKIFKDGFQ